MFNKFFQKNSLLSLHAVVVGVHGQYAENKNAESLRAWKSRRNVQKPNLTKRSPFGFRRFFLGVFSSA